jgi:hypothetical protein
MRHRHHSDLAQLFHFETGWSGDIAARPVHPHRSPVTVRVRSVSGTVPADAAVEDKYTQTAVGGPLRDCRTRRQRLRFPATPGASSPESEIVELKSFGTE